MDQHDNGSAASSTDKEVLTILMESDLYLELPLKERRQLFLHIIRTYLEPDPGRPRTC